jgi:hypothetical protein
MNQTTKRPPGRPKKAATAAQEQPKPKAKRAVKRKDVKYEAREFKALQSSGTFLLMQSGVTIYDEETDSVREIRYCERENSIFRDDQHANSVKTPITFRMGRLFVPRTKPNLMNYLTVHPGNKANGGSLFTIIDTVKKAEIDIDQEFLVNDAVNLIRAKDLDDLLAVALAFNIDVDRPIAEIKHDLLIKAKKSPKTFIESFDNPVVSMKSLVKQAKSYNIISVSSKEIKWVDTNKHIISVPAGQDPVDVFVRYCMTEAAAPLVAEIERQLA